MELTGTQVLKNIYANVLWLTLTILGCISLDVFEFVLVAWETSRLWSENKAGCFNQDTGDQTEFQISLTGTETDTRRLTTSGNSRRVISFYIVSSKVNSYLIGLRHPVVVECNIIVLVTSVSVPLSYNAALNFWAVFTHRNRGLCHESGQTTHNKLILSDTMSTIKGIHPVVFWNISYSGNPGKISLIHLHY